MSLTPQNLQCCDGKHLAIRHSCRQAIHRQEDIRKRDNACPQMAKGLLNRSRVTAGIVVYLHISICLKSQVEAKTWSVDSAAKTDSK